MTISRVTHTSMREAWLQATQNLQTQLSRTQLQISTGRKFASPAEDPVAATRALQLNGLLQTNQQFTRNAELAKNRLSLEESALGQISDVLQRVRELAVQANNATQSNESRTLIGIEVSQQLDAVLQLSNSQDGNGQYLFSGYQTRTQPFARQGGSVVYSGDQGQRQLQIGPDRSIADSDTGADVFMLIQNVTNQNQDLFQTVQNFIDALNTPAVDVASQAQLHADIDAALGNLDRALDKVSQLRTGVGSRLAAIDTQENINAEVDLNLTSLLSELQDLDYAGALTRLQQQLTSLQAAQASYAQMQGLSLFDYF